MVSLFNVMQFFRAITFKPATKCGANDGQNEELRIKHDRFTKPRLFQLIKRNRIHDSFHYKQRKKVDGQSRDNYDVIAKKYTCPWSEQLNGVLTREQITADEVIIQCTRIEKNSDGVVTKCFFHFENSSMVRGAQTLPKNHVSPIFVLNMLRIASRGKFLSKYKK